MRNRIAAVLIGTHVLAAAVLALAGETTNATSNSAIVAVPKLEDDAYDWFDRHSQILKIQKTLNPEIVLIGDSITHFWGGEPRSHQNGPKSWSDTFGSHRVLNIGFGWDRTQNVLWRLDHGEMDDTHPKVVVLNIGTNNFSETRNAHANTPEEVAEAILKICDQIAINAPKARIVVMGIFPRGAKADDPVRIPIAQTNKLVAKLLEGKQHISFIDLTDRFLHVDGSISSEVMSDAIHPTEKGYKIWSDALVDAGIFK